MDVAIGVDAHKDELAVAAVDGLGRVMAQATFANAPAEHAVLVAWVMSHGPARRVGIEGAGNYAWQLTLALQRAGEDVREVPGHLRRRERRHQRHPGKSDPTDAVAIARVVAREEALPAAPLAGPARDLKVLVNYRGGLATERTRVANQLHADLRALRPGYGRTLGHLNGRTALETARRLLAACTGVQADVARRRLARLRALERELATLQRTLRQRLADLGRALPAVCGVGPVIAARVHGEVGNGRRYRSAPAFAMACGVAPIPASSGQTTGHRLNPGGNRRLNAALHTIALVQARVDGRAKAYLARKRAEGKSWREALRCLKRQLADVIYRALLRDADDTTPLTTYRSAVRHRHQRGPGAEVEDALGPTRETLLEGAMRIERKPAVEPVVDRAQEEELHAVAQLGAPTREQVDGIPHQARRGGTLHRSPGHRGHRLPNASPPSGALPREPVAAQPCIRHSP